MAKDNGGELPTAMVLMALDGRSKVQAHGPREMPIWGDVYLSSSVAMVTFSVAKIREGATV